MIVLDGVVAVSTAFVVSVADSTAVALPDDVMVTSTTAPPQPGKWLGWFRFGAMTVRASYPADC
ncbi:hypothetical protein ACFXG4_17710 [Nocardia sp. NPDC059246]|uniref:hypothetical protein n=1 Tax=unclassified Nocardia TaxID=2637762 RepID=UPI00367DE336